MKIFLTSIFFQLTCMVAVAQIDKQFVGEWKLESAELRETLYDDSQPETKAVYTLEKLNELIHFNAITEMRFIDEEVEIDEFVGNDESFINTIHRQYQNPLVKISNPYIEFAEQGKPEELSHNQYGFVFTTPENVLLISHEVFYPKDGKPMKARLYLTFSKLTK